MKKYNILLVTISSIVTILTIIIWIDKLQTKSIYGSPASSLPFILGLFTIPAFLWFITYITAPKKKNFNKRTKQIYKGSIIPDLIEKTDPEITIIQDSLKRFYDELNKLMEQGELLNRSLAQNLINEQTHNLEIDKLNEKYDSILNKKTKYERKLNAIININDELQDLEELCENGVISIYLKETKRKELIDKEMNRINDWN
jgi:hypothetical protein